MKKTEQLDSTTSPDGTVLTLFRHDGHYFIRANGAELMSTRRHASEDRLADTVCAPLHATPGARVLIGGLGLGFTLRESLRTLRDDARVDVVELLDAVIEWNQREEYGLAARELADPRVTLIRNDVAHVIGNGQGRYDGIMMDVDNGADAMTNSANRRLYRDAGIRTAVTALRPHGRLAYWSAGRDTVLEEAMQRAGLRVSVSTVRAWGSGGPEHFIYTGQRAG